MQVGVVGLGHMGSGMAASLLKAGHLVTVYNRTRSKADPLVALGAVVADNVADACRGEAVITMLASDDAVRAAMEGREGILAGLPRNGIHISSGTISTALAVELTERHAKAGQRFIAAPVFGRPEVAAQGQLFIVAAGPKDAIATAQPLFDAMGRKTIVVSETPKAANLVKLSGNFMIATVIESLGEAMALVEKGGVSRQQYLEILTSSLFDAPVYKTYGNLVANRKFQPAGFAAPLGQKDIRLTLAASEELEVPLPLANLLRDRFLALRALGGDDLDWSAISELSAIEAGQPSSSLKPAAGTG